MKKTHLLALLLILLISTGCKKEVELIRVSSISLSRSSLSLEEGESFQLEATIIPNNAYNKSISWSTGDSKIATVKEGRVSAVKEGSTMIVVTSSDGGKTARCKVEVRPKIYHAAAVTLSEREINLYAGESFSLEATIYPENAINKTIIWSSSDEKIVAIDENGEGRAIEEGEAVVTATTEDGGYTATCKVTVIRRPQATGLSISFYNQSGTYGPSIYIGKDYSYNATFTPSNAEVELEWTIDEPKIAEIKPNGTSCPFRTTGFGKARITLTDKISGLSASDEIETCVTDFMFTENTGVTSSGYPKVSIAVGESYQLHWSCKPYISEGLFQDLGTLKMKERGNGSIYYIVDEPTVITIDENGVITGVMPGTIILSPMNMCGVYKTTDSGVFVEVVNGYSEIEPNNDFPYATQIKDGKDISFSLSSTSDVDVFRFNNPATTYGSPLNITTSIHYEGDAYPSGARALRWELYNSEYLLLGSGTLALTNEESTFITDSYLNTQEGFYKFYYPDNWQIYPDSLPRGIFTLSVKALE